MVVVQGNFIFLAIFLAIKIFPRPAKTIYCIFAISTTSPPTAGWLLIAVAYAASIS
jgi:hypothetical protein